MTGNPEVISSPVRLVPTNVSALSEARFRESVKLGEVLFARSIEPLKVGAGGCGGCGDDDAETDGEAFAVLLTRQMRDVSPDMHLVVVYSQAPLPQRLTGPTPEDLLAIGRQWSTKTARSKRSKSCRTISGI